MICTQCGKVATDQNAFCTNCGKRFESVLLSGSQSPKAGNLPPVHSKSMSPNKAGFLTVVAVIGLLVLWVCGGLLWQGLKFAQQSGRAQVAQQASASGTCITELNGYYHCAQDRITPSGANITLRQCSRSEVTTAFPICWSDQPVPAPPKLAPELAQLPVSQWIQVPVSVPEYKTGMTLSFCKTGFRCGSDENGFVKGPFYVVNQLALQNFTNRPTVYLRDKYTGLSEDDKIAVEAFCQQGFPILEYVPVRNAYGEPLQGVPVCDRNQLPVSASVPPTVAEAFVPSGNLEEKKFGDYTIRIYGNPDEDSEGALEILKLGTRVYTEQQASFQIEGTGVPIGADVTGAGIPNLVVREYSGGAHCCTSFVIFELGNTFHKVTKLEQGVCGEGKFERQNNGRYLFRGCDPSLAIDGSRREVILGYENGDYRPLK
jgi:hypothetical protein